MVTRTTFIGTLILSFTAAIAAGQPKDILFFGNSFTFGRDSDISVPEGVQAIAVAAGHPEPFVIDASFSSADLDDHLTSSLHWIDDLAPENTWEAVVMQERSTKPTTSHSSGNPGQFRLDARELYSEVTAHSPEVEAVLFETWARQPGHVFYTGNSPEFPGGPAQMQAELRQWYQVAANDIQSDSLGGTGFVAPVGDAWEFSNWDDLHASDGFHAQNRGTVLASLVIFGTIYRQNVGGLDLSSLMTSLELGPLDELELKFYADHVLPDFGPQCDLDDNNLCDVTDLRHLYDDIAMGSSNSDSDMDGNGIVNNADIDAWLTLAGIENEKEYRRGDANLDGNVGGADFTVLAANFGNSGLPSGYWEFGNFDGNSGGDFSIGGTDFTNLAANFGYTSVLSVPEPRLEWLAGFGLTIAMLATKSKAIRAQRNPFSMP